VRGIIKSFEEICFAKERLDFVSFLKQVISHGFIDPLSIIEAFSVFLGRNNSKFAFLFFNTVAKKRRSWRFVHRFFTVECWEPNLNDFGQHASKNTKKINEMKRKKNKKKELLQSIR
jgi:hypothetical protein